MVITPRFMSVLYYLSKTLPCSTHVEDVSGPKSELLLSLPFYSADIRKFPEPKLPRYCLGRSLRWGTNIGAEVRDVLFSLWLSFMVIAAHGIRLRNVSRLQLVVEPKSLKNVQLVSMSSSSPTIPSA